MARHQGVFTPEDENSVRGSNSSRKEAEVHASSEGDFSVLEDRIVDLEAEDQSPFLRRQKRVSVRGGPFQRGTARSLRTVLLILTIGGITAAAAIAAYRYGKESWRFRMDSSDAIEILGNKNVARQQVLEVMGGDIGRNVFFIPLDERQQQLEKIPWVESATVMRLLPNRLRIVIRERVPVAFAKVGDHIELVDANGVTMAMPLGGNYSFPVIVGNSESDPLSTRAARMKIYLELVRQLDSTGANYSHDLDEVDLSDPEDVRVTVADQQGSVLIHLGSSNYLDRFNLYKAHIEEWRQQMQQLRSVDLRFDRQVILNPGAPSPAPPEIKQAPQPQAKPISAKPASAGRHRKRRP